VSLSLLGLPLSGRAKADAHQGETETVRSRDSRPRQVKPLKYRHSWREADALKFSASRQPRGLHHWLNVEFLTRVSAISSEGFTETLGAGSLVFIFREVFAEIFGCGVYFQ